MGKNMTDNKTLIEMRQFLRAENSRFGSGVFTELPREDWPPGSQTIPLIKVLRSRELLVLVFAGEVTRLAICRTELNDSGQLKDGITWDEMQAVKDGCGFEEFDAVEAYPRKKDITNYVNMRHLWIVPPDYAKFFWRNGRSSGFKSEQIAEELLRLLVVKR